MEPVLNENKTFLAHSVKKICIVNVREERNGEEEAVRGKKFSVRDCSYAYFRFGLCNGQKSNTFLM